MTPQQILGDPNFQQLPDEEKLKVMLQVDPEKFGKLPPEEQKKVIGFKGVPAPASTSTPAPAPAEGAGTDTGDTLGSRIGSVAKGFSTTALKPLADLAVGGLTHPISTYEGVTGASANPVSLGEGPLADLAAKGSQATGLSKIPHAEMAARTYASLLSKSPTVGPLVLMVKGLYDQSKGTWEKGRQALASGDPKMLSEAAGEGIGILASLAAGGAKGVGLGKIPFKGVGPAAEVGAAGTKAAPAAEAAAGAADVPKPATTTAVPPVTNIPAESLLNKLPPELADTVMKLTGNLAEGAKRSGRFDPAVLDRILPDELKPHAQDIHARVVGKTAALMHGDELLSNLKDQFGEHPTGPTEAIEVHRYSAPGSFDVVQRSGGKIVGGAEVRNGTLAMITGGKPFGSPISAKGIYSTLDELGVKRNDVLSPFGEEARYRHGQKLATESAAGAAQAGQSSVSGVPSPGSPAPGDVNAAAQAGGAGGATPPPGGALPKLGGQPPEAQAVGRLPEPDLLPSQKPGQTFQKPLSVVESYLEKTPGSAPIMQAFKEAQQTGPKGVVSNMVKKLLDRVSTSSLSDEETRNLAGTAVEDAKKVQEAAFDKRYGDLEQQTKGLKVDISASKVKAKELMADLTAGSKLSGVVDPAVKTLKTFTESPGTRQDFGTLKALKSDLYDLAQIDEMVGTKGQGALKQLIKSVSGDMESAANQVPGLGDKMRKLNAEYGDYKTTFNESVISEINRASKAGLQGKVGAKTIAGLIDQTGAEGLARIKKTLPDHVYRATVRNWLEGKINDSISGELGTQKVELRGSKLQGILENVGESKLKNLLDPQTVADLKQVTEIANRISSKGQQGLMGSLLAAKQYAKGGAAVSLLMGWHPVAAAGVLGGLGAEQFLARSLAKIITKPGGVGVMRRFMSSVEAAGRGAKGAQPAAVMYGKSLERILEGEDEESSSQPATASASASASAR